MPTVISSQHSWHLNNFTELVKDFFPLLCHLRKTVESDSNTSSVHEFLSFQPGNSTHWNHLTLPQVLLSFILLSQIYLEEPVQVLRKNKCILLHILRQWMSYWKLCLNHKVSFFHKVAKSHYIAWNLLSIPMLFKRLCNAHKNNLFSLREELYNTHLWQKKNFNCFNNK